MPGDDAAAVWVLEEVLIIGRPLAPRMKSQAPLLDSERIIWLSPADLRAAGLGSGQTSADREADRHTWGSRYPSSRKPSHS
jgi:hypothetical protein